jgi:hypothetical protein
MTVALFTLAGALVGVLGTVLTELVRGRREDRRAWRDDLRSVCVELGSQVSQMRDLSHELQRTPEDADLRRAAQETHRKARAAQELLRLTSRSIETQEAARWLIHGAYYQWRATQGGRGDFWAARRTVDEWLTRFYAAAREELGLAGSQVYEDPSGGLPVPGAVQTEGSSS